VTSLAAQDAEYQKLYQQVNSSIVRVTVVQDAMAIVRKEGLTSQYDEWLKGAADHLERGDRSGRVRGFGNDGRGTGGGSATNQTRSDGGNPFQGGGGFGRGGPSGFGAGPGGPSSFGGRGGGVTNSMVRGFYIDQAFQAQRDKNYDLAAHYRAQALRVQMNPAGFQGEMLAAVLDNKGNALLLGGVFRESQGPDGSPMKVLTADGTQSEATFIGSNLYTAFTLIKLNAIKGTTPTAWSKTKLKPGQTLLPVTFGQPFAPLVHVLPRPGEPFSEDRLAPDDQTTPRFERGGAFLFDVEGHLAAVVTAGGGWAGERFALSGSRMQRDVAYILANQTDIEPRSLGVDFTPAAPPIPPFPNAPKAVQDAYNAEKKIWDDTAKIIGNHRAVRVKAVTPNSLAARAQLKPGDVLLSIDGRRMSEFVTSNGQALPGLIQLQVDLVTRTDAVPLVIVRDGKEQTLQMSLK
jgi:S1-C subfamily serine protease